MALLAGQRMMPAVLMGGNAGTGTSAFDPVGRLTPGSPHVVQPRLGPDTARMGGHDYVVVCGVRGARR